MSHFDHLDLDGHLLRLLLAVHEEASVTRASQRLGVTQSAVSHGLEKLRGIVGDPLFRQVGAGHPRPPPWPTCWPSVRAACSTNCAPSAWPAGFEPARLVHDFTIAANDLQRDLLLPGLLRRLRAQAPGVTMRVIPSGAPEAAMLRDEACQLIITPRPPEGADIFQKRLFVDQYRVFYDPAHTTPPPRKADYQAAEHVTVVYEPRRSLDVDQWLQACGVSRRIVASVPGMAGLASLLRGGPWLATAPSLLARGALQGLAHAPVPMTTPPLPMYMVWHRRHHADPVQCWLRDALEAQVAQALAELQAPERRRR